VTGAKDFVRGNAATSNPHPRIRCGSHSPPAYNSVVLPLAEPTCIQRTTKLVQTIEVSLPGHRAEWERAEAESEGEGGECLAQ
jgi:hypothetical protein